MTTLIIDGDLIAYKVAAGAEIPVNWGDGLWTLHSTEDDIKRGVDEAIHTLISRTGHNNYRVALSDNKNNFRKQVADYYKANRSNTRKPMLLPFARDYIMDNHYGEIWANLEADDVLGILASRSDEFQTWTLDKDLKTVPGTHWFDDKMTIISQEDADYWFYTQALTGDITDNYSGCPKIGAKTAEKILDKECSWENVVATYINAGLGEEIALENARLARILRDGEYNQDTGEVSLWSPN